MIARHVIALTVLSLVLAASSRAAELPAAEWTVNGGNLGNDRFSTLDQLSPDTIKRLGGAWRTELPGGISKATPIVSNGVMYVVTGGAALFDGAGGAVYALDAKTGAIRWAFPAPGGGISALNKGAAVGGGNVFVGLGNAHIAAIDAKTGKLAWEGIAGDEPPVPGQFVSAAPVYADGLVICGVGSGDAGIRGRVVALDAKTGKVVWRFDTIPGPGQPGHDTWPKDGDAWQHGGAGVWASPAVDTDLGLVIFGTGNAYPQYAGQVRAGDNLYSASVVALDLKTGKYRWHYQTAHHEIWEADLGAPMVLYDAKVGGKTVKAVAALRTDGYIFELDRKSGKPLGQIEERPVKQNARLMTAPTQPFPVGADKVGPNCVQEDAIPAGFVAGCFWDPVDYDQPNIVLPGATRFAPMAFDPLNRVFLVAGGAIAHWAQRQPDPYFFNFGTSIPGIKQHGLLAAFNADTNKVVWQKEVPYPIQYGSGATATKGGLVFHGEPDGNIQAYEAKTGDLAWQFQTGAPVAGPIVAYRLGGQEYVAAVANQYVWAFAIDGTVSPLPAPPAPQSVSTFSGRIVSTDQVTLSNELENMGTHKDIHYIDEYSLKPVRIKVKAGTTVTWTNSGKVAHDASDRDGSWTTGEIQPGQSATVKFDKPGSYTYICKEHPWTIGQLIVE
jgi:quinohemoprotein ethanol dehydrogenase